MGNDSRSWVPFGPRGNYAASRIRSAKLRRNECRPIHPYSFQIVWMDQEIRASSVRRWTGAAAGAQFPWPSRYWVVSGP